MGSKILVKKVDKLPEMPSGDSQPSKPSDGESNAVKCDWQLGDLMWARVGRYPFWPCLVIKDPRSGTYFEMKKMGRSSQQLIHVQYFGDNGSHCWVSKNQILEYTGKSNFLKFAESKKKDKKYSSALLQPGKNRKWDFAVQEAEEAALKSRSERVQFFEEFLPIEIGGKSGPKSLRVVEDTNKRIKSSSQKRPLSNDESQEQIGDSPKAELTPAQEKMQKTQYGKKNIGEENSNVDIEKPVRKKVKRRKREKLPPGIFEVFVDRCANLFAMDTPEFQTDMPKCIRFMRAMWSSMSEEEKSRYHGSYEDVFPLDEYCTSEAVSTK